jgi:hypothetical protein
VEKVGGRGGLVVINGAAALLPGSVVWEMDAVLARAWAGDLQVGSRSRGR